MHGMSQHEPFPVWRHKNAHSCQTTHTCTCYCSSLITIYTQRAPYGKCICSHPPGHKQKADQVPRCLAFSTDQCRVQAETHCCNTLHSDVFATVCTETDTIPHQHRNAGPSTVGAHTTCSLARTALLVLPCSYCPAHTARLVLHGLYCPARTALLVLPSSYRKPRAARLVLPYSYFHCSYCPARTAKLVLPCSYCPARTSRLVLA